MKRYSPLLHGSSRSWDHDRKPHKDSGGQYYENANRLYGIQADTAQFMLGLGRDKLPGAVDSYAAAANQFSDPAFEERMAGQAGADAEQAIGQQTAALGRNLARYGINPNSARFSAVAGDNAIRGAAMKVGAMNNARRYVQDKRFGVAKDFYSSLVGMNSDAAAQAGQAGGNFMQMGNNAQARRDNEDAAWGNAIGMGAAYAFKDGGAIEVRKMAAGGLFGAAGSMPPPPPVQTRPQRAGIMDGVKAGRQLKAAASMKPNATLAGMADMGNVSGAGMAGAEAGLGGNTATAGILGQEAGMGGVAAGGMSEGTAASMLGEDVAATLAAQDAAVTGTAGLAAETTAALGAAETAAAGTAGATSAMAGAAVAAPWLAAGVGIAAALGLFADGGEVKKKPPKYDKAFDDAAKKYGVDADLLRRMAHKESGGNTKAESHKGAKGLMQLMPETAAAVGVKDPHDPVQSIHGAAKYMRSLLRRYEGDTTKAVAAYNAGPGAVDKYGGVPPYRETVEYVRHLVPGADVPELPSRRRGRGRRLAAKGLPPIQEGAASMDNRVSAIPGVDQSRSAAIRAASLPMPAPSSSTMLSDRELIQRAVWTPAQMPQETPLPAAPAPSASPMLASAVVDQRNIERGASPMLQPAVEAAPKWTRATPPYQIKRGDNLTRIAKAHGTTVEALMAANPHIKDPNFIRAGDTLNVGFAEGGKVDKRSITDHMKASGFGSSFDDRKRVYEALFKERYKGTAEQNTKLLDVMEAAKQEEESDSATLPPPSPDRIQMQDGGDVAGPGTETSDDVPAWLSDGEFVVNADAVKMPGVKRTLENINAAGLAKRYGVM